MSLKSKFTPAGVALIFVGTMVGLTLIAVGVGVGLMHGVAVFAKPPATTLMQAAGQTPPLPRLQTDRLADRAVVVGVQKQASTYGWTDRAAGRAHVPVDVAMRMLAAQGWPGAEADR